MRGVAWRGDKTSRRGTGTLAMRFCWPMHTKENSMPNNKNPNEKLPGEDPEGKFHYNPGNVAGKKPNDPEQTAENLGDPAPDSKTEAAQKA
jgi:hypothetical protein